MRPNHTGTLALNQVGRSRQPQAVGRGRRLQPPTQRRRPLSRMPAERYPLRATMSLVGLPREMSERHRPPQSARGWGSAKGAFPALVASTAGTSSNNLDLGSLEGDNAYDQSSFPALD